MSDGSPPPSWYDPPEGHMEECNCQDCHEEHDWVIMADWPDYKCCQEEREQAIESGEYCPVHKQFYCEECDNNGNKAVDL